MKEGDTVTTGQTTAVLKPDQASISAALRALGYVGTNDDLPLIEPYANSATSDIRTAVQAAAESIRSRARH